MHPKSGGSGVYEETAALLDWGFKEGAKAQPVGALVDPLSEGGASAAPTRKAATAAAGAPATAAGDGGSSSWGLVGGAGGAVALLAGGAYAWRRRRRVVGDEAPEGRQDGQDGHQG
jgi:D-alanyl-D-alanine carboxypeptidase (penicillin-binding protein 5/6)